MSVCRAKDSMPIVINVGKEQDWVKDVSGRAH